MDCIKLCWEEAEFLWLDLTESGNIKLAIDSPMIEFMFACHECQMKNTS